MNEERLFILKMVEEGKITADEGAALLEALEGGSERGGAGTQESDSGTSAGTAGFDDDERRPDWAAQVRETVQSALKNVPHVTDELRDNFKDVGNELRNSLKEIREEMRGRRLVDLSGLVDFFTHMKDVGIGRSYEFEESCSGEFEPGVQKPQVRVVTRNGRISIKGWDRPGYEVNVTKRIHASDEGKAQEIASKALDVETGDGRLEVVAGDVRGASISVELRLPAAQVYSLSARSQNGSVTVAGVKSDTGSFATTNGSLSLTDVRAQSLSVEATNGRIACEDLHSDHLEVKTVNGGIAWSGTSNEASLTTTNGSVRLAPLGAFGSAATGGIGAVGSAGNAAKFRVATVNGGIRVTLPEDDTPGVSFDAKGRVVKIVDQDERLVTTSQEGTAGHGKFVTGRSKGYDQAETTMRFELKTVNGTVHIQADEEGDKDGGKEEGGADAGRTDADPENA